MDDEPLRTLSAEDNPDDTPLIRNTFRKGNRFRFEVEHLKRLATGLARITALFFLFMAFHASGARFQVDAHHRQEEQSAYSNELAGRLVLTGSSTMAPMVAAIADRFQSLHPEVRLEVNIVGSVHGLRDLRRGRCDIAMVSRPLKDEEDALFAFPIARDGICLVVHRSNPVETLSSRHIVGIYTGEITRWKEVGGLDRSVTVVSRPPGRPAFELFTHYFKIDETTIKAHSIAGANSEAIGAVVKNPDAIVIVSVGEAERKARENLPIKSLPIDEVEATSQNVRSGDFPISRPLCLVTKEAPTKLERAFINFCLSSQVLDIILKFDFVPYLD